MRPDERYLVISADCHGGGELREYRDYLPSRYHDEFDAWAATYEVPYPDLLGPENYRNWDSERRLQELEDDGVVAEVIYPNTIPPFFPKASLSEQPPAADAGDLELRWAGLQAHNRWMADFCAKAPGRRAGMVQVMLHDLDAAVAEVRWAKEAGLTGGVLLPGTPPGSGLPQLYETYYEPLWQVCEELQVPVNHHSGSAAPPMGDTNEDKVIFMLEVTWWAHRALTHLLVGGVFERHPGLQAVFTEQGTQWVPEELFKLDFFFTRMRTAVGSQEYEWGRPVMQKLPRQPSEYFARQCQMGSSFIRPYEMDAAKQIGHDKVLWGVDYPHREGSFPFSREALRASFASVDPDDVAKMVGGNAARVYGFDLDALRPIADKVGPTVAEIAEPLVPGQVPIEAEKCPALVGFGAAPTPVH